MLELWTRQYLTRLFAPQCALIGIHCISAGDGHDEGDSSTLGGAGGRQGQAGGVLVASEADPPVCPCPPAVLTVIVRWYAILFCLCMHA